MSATYLSVRLRRARDSYANWVKNDPVLYYGEIAVAYDIPNGQHKDRMKVGDGKRRFSQLPWVNDFTKVDSDEIGRPLGVVPLDENGKVPMKYIPEIKPVAVPEVAAVLEYTGEPQQPEFLNYDPEDVLLTGTLEATEPNIYHAAAKPCYGRAWEDGSTDTVFIEWEIKS